ncbi:MAG: ATP-binding protein [Candidatus Rokuibacteriota bacterium]
MVVLVGLRRSAKVQGWTLTIRPPRVSKLMNYCRYAGLLAEFEVGPPPEAHSDNATTPVRAFTQELPLAAINEVVMLAKSQMELSRTAQDDLTLVLTELTQNVLDHAESPIGGLISARAYRNVRDVRFAVADYGIGIRQTLGRRFDLGTDKAAIRRAFQEEVTSGSSARNLGLGLAHLHGIVRVTHGRMVVYSARGYLRHDNGKDSFGSADVPFPGTIAFVRLPARQIDAEESEVTDIWK